MNMAPQKAQLRESKGSTQNNSTKPPEGVYSPLAALFHAPRDRVSYFLTARLLIGVTHSHQIFRHASQPRLLRPKDTFNADEELFLV